MKIRVGNLSSDTTADDLRMLLECFGRVSDVRMDRFPGQATAEMPKKAEATEAIAGLNGQHLKGRDIEVAEFQERAARRGPSKMRRRR